MKRGGRRKHEEVLTSFGLSFVVGDTLHESFNCFTDLFRLFHLNRLRVGHNWKCVCVCEGGQEACVCVCVCRLMDSISLRARSGAAFAASDWCAGPKLRLLKLPRAALLVLRIR